MWAFYPLAYPIALLLNLVLGKEIGLSYSREELIALLALHAQSGQTECGPQGDLNDMEAQILTGVLRFTEKTAQDVFTPLKYVQAVGLHESLDLSTLNCVAAPALGRICRGPRAHGGGLRSDASAAAGHKAAAAASEDV